VTKTGAAPQIPLDGLASLGFNTANNRINTAGFEYDPAGNQTRAVINDSGTQQQYRYDCAGRLAQVLDANGATLATYTYGASNQRLVSVEGGVTKYFAWDGGQIIAEYESSGANALVWKTSYVYLGGRLLATTSGAGGTETRFHHPDRLGTRLVTDADGTVASEQLSMPFGTMLPFTQTYGGENSYQHPTLSNPSKKRFTSYDRSEATGLDYAVNRFYSPQQGRFAQVDPIGMGAVSLGNPQSLNLYSYVENDPVNRVDPTGKSWGLVAGALVNYVSSYQIHSVTINASLNDPITVGAGSSSDQMLIELDTPNPDDGGGQDEEKKPRAPKEKERHPDRLSRKECEELFQKIENLARDLEKRINEFRQDKINLRIHGNYYERKERDKRTGEIKIKKGGLDTHIERYYQSKDDLKTNLDKYNKGRCGNRGGGKGGGHRVGPVLEYAWSIWGFPADIPDYKTGLKGSEQPVSPPKPSLWQRILESARRVPWL
jgi:RHS repeat-associated protein